MQSIIAGGAHVVISPDGMPIDALLASRLWNHWEMSLEAGMPHELAYESCVALFRELISVPVRAPILNHPAVLDKEVV